MQNFIKFRNAALYWKCKFLLLNWQNIFAEHECFCFLFLPEQMDIVTTPKDYDPQLTAWKGASILSCLESAQELWILPSEWEKSGVKILRERAPFIW